MNGIDKAKQRLDPAATVIAKLGGVRALARDLGIDPSAISKWQTRSDSGYGGAGLIPAKYHWSLLTLARRKRIELSADDLIRPRAVA